MGKRIRTVLSCTAIVLVAIGASYILAAVRADSPEQLVSELQTAASRGDVEGFLSRLTTETRQIVEASYADRILLREAHAEFEKALGEKFGKGSEWITDSEEEGDLSSAVNRIAALELVSKKEVQDGSVELNIRTTVKLGGDKTEVVENRAAARKENGEWKLSLGYPETRLDTPRIKNEVERIAGEVREGKYEDRFAAMIALDNAIRRKEVK